MMILKKIDAREYEKYVLNSNEASMYQSICWYNLKKEEGKKVELLGLFDEDNLVGVSLVIYLRILKKYYIAYATRGFLYDYKDIFSFKKALVKYFKKKKVVLFRMDPNIVLAKYDKDLKKEEILESYQILESLKYYGFKHYGFNMAFETMQFRFVHKLDLVGNWDKQKEGMSKSTRKNIELSDFKGVRIRKGTEHEIDIACKFFDMSGSRKHFQGFDKKYYEKLFEVFKDKVTLYIAYIDKNIYRNNLESKLKEIDCELDVVHDKMKHDNVGKKLIREEEILNNSKEKYLQELNDVNNMVKKCDIAAMITISMYDEVVSYVSGMDNNYRKFNPKYVMYPAMIKDAIASNLKTVNFLGVKNIFDKNDSDYGMYEVKRGFGGNTIEYIGEFDLPIKKGLYILYKLKTKLKGGK